MISVHTCLFHYLINQQLPLTGCSSLTALLASPGRAGERIEPPPAAEETPVIDLDRSSRSCTAAPRDALIFCHYEDPKAAVGSFGVSVHERTIDSRPLNEEVTPGGEKGRRMTHNNSPDDSLQPPPASSSPAFRGGSGHLVITCLCPASGGTLFVLVGGRAAGRGTTHRLMAS